MSMEQGDALVQKKVQRVGGKATSHQIEWRHQPRVKTTPEAAHLKDECENNNNNNNKDIECEIDIATKEPHPPTGGGSRLTDVGEFLSSQLITCPKPLRVPPTHDDMEDDEPSWLRFSPKNAPSHSELNEPSIAQDTLQDFMITSKGHTISDEVYRQREEDARKKELVTRRRRTTLAKFNNQKRNRLDLELRAGLPVSLESKQLYCLQSPAGATKANIRLMKDQKREEARQIKDLKEKQRTEFFRYNRINLLKTMSVKMERRRELETTMGTKQSSLPDRTQTLRMVMQQQQSNYQQEADQVETTTSLSCLDKFDAAHRQFLKTTNQPRKRDLPYCVNAPFKRENNSACALPQVGGQ